MANESKPSTQRTGIRASVTLIPSKHDADEIRTSKEVPARLRESLARLLAHDDEVLGWLAADAARAARFVVDPVGTLRRSGLDLPQDLLAGLEQGVAASRRSDVVPTNVKLDNVTINVRSAPDPGNRGGES